QQDAQDAMSDVSLSAQGFVSLASHNVYYVKLNASFIKPSIFCAPFSSMHGLKPLTRIPSLDGSLCRSNPGQIRQHPHKMPAADLRYRLCTEPTA
ncbi:hypothetical protein LES14_33620, partial [Pseudomonas aeruginosa]|uniref:hypothetical protein n=1 Tax=Pseudomonas aeruginosa TaxID=287 RepID=UPI0038968B7C